MYVCVYIGTHICTYAYGNRTETSWQAAGSPGEGDGNLEGVMAEADRFGECVTFL